MPEVFNLHGFGPSVAVKQRSSCSWVDHLRFGSTTGDWVAHFGLAFASPPAQNALGSPLIVTRRLIKQKARGHQLAPASTPCKHIISGTISLRSRSEEHMSELQSRGHLVCRLLLEEKKV